MVPKKSRDSTVAPSGGPALAMLQIASVPLGLRALDALVKEASVEVALRGTVQCGHYLIAFGGEVEPVQRSFRRAFDTAGGCVCDHVLLPDAEPRILPAFRDATLTWPASGDALGVLQTAFCPSLLTALDASLKGALVELVELRLGDGLGGKALATLWGEIHDVEAAVELAQAALARHTEQHGVASDGAMLTVIPNADAETQSAVSAGTRFYGEWRG